MVYSLSFKTSSKTAGTFFLKVAGGFICTYGFSNFGFLGDLQFLLIF